MNFKTFVFFAMLFAWFAKDGSAQSSTTCGQTGSFTIAANGTALDNRLNTTAGCIQFRLTYFSTGFSALSIQIEGAPDVAGAAGSWTAIASANVAQGTNPSTGLQGEVMIQAYFPHIRVAVSSVTGTGTIRYALNGVNATLNQEAGPPISGSSAPTANVNVASLAGTTTDTNSGNKSAGTLRVVIATDQPSITGTFPTSLSSVSGTTVIPCTSSLAFNLASSGDTEIIPLTASQVIRICSIDWSTTAAEDVKITTGTGTNCGTGTANKTGLYKTVTAMARDYGMFAPLTFASGAAVCLNQSAAQALGGVVIYDKR